MADGTFVDLRTHWLGRTGAAAVHLARRQGGVLHVARDTGTVPEPPAQVPPTSCAWGRACACGPARAAPW